jgi:hypothetical protein
MSKVPIINLSYRACLTELEDDTLDKDQPRGTYLVAHGAPRKITPLQLRELHDKRIPSPKHA